MSGNNTKFDDDNNGDLRDPALRRALDHAPDSDARPDPRTRDAILKMAHNLAEARGFRDGAGGWFRGGAVASRACARCATRW